ncbi:MAG: transcriptional regulator [Alphaproteobacteria bacterium]|nr:transcriptional regulator [Alphaproteobacteria bacterium]
MTGECFSETLRAAAEPDWTRATTHPFTRALAADTLELAVYARYLVQDYVFLDALTALVGAAVAAAPSMVEKKRFAGFLAVLTGDENAYFGRAFEALGVSPASWRAAARAPVTHRFEGLLAEARRGDYADILAVLVPVEWVYETWASAVADARPSRFYYAEWITLHTDPGFRDFVAWMRAELDRHGPDGGVDRVAGRVALFRRAVALEVAFFDAAFASK